MALDEFTTVYKKASDVFTADGFDKRWSNMKPKMVALFTGGGLATANATALDVLRTNLETAAKGSAKPADAVADEILALSQTGAAGFQDRAALIKLIKHMYYVTIKGNQDVWVIDHPKDFTKWAFDETNGKTEAALKALLKMDTETFGEGYRKVLSNALQEARKWSGDAVAKLGTPDASTKAIIKRWFHGDAGTDAEITATGLKLLEGFKKILNACNSTCVIFSDHPPERTGGDYETTYAEVSSVDKSMTVIYMFPYFFKQAGVNAKLEVANMWLCALTIIHELSHKLADTDDNSYDDLGLKPGGRRLKVADAIKTADSWGYFSADLVGHLPKDKFDAYYK